MDYAYNKRRRDARRAKRLGPAAMLPGLDVAADLPSGMVSREAYEAEAMAAYDKALQTAEAMARESGAERGRVMRAALIQAAVVEALQAADIVTAMICRGRVGMAGRSVYNPGVFDKKVMDIKRTQILKAVRLLEAHALIGSDDDDRTQILVLLLDIRTAAGIGWEVDAADLPEAIARKLAGG